MRFLMFEDFPRITDKDIEKWKTADDKQRSKIITNIIRGYGVSKESPSWRQALRKACYRFGIDPVKNPFIKFFEQYIEKVDYTPDNDYFSFLVDMVESSNLDLKNNFLFKEELYRRNLQDFMYTVKVFNTVNTPHLLKKFFNNTEGISEVELYDKEGKIKPAGSEETASDIGTLYGTVESWSGADGENDRDTDDRKSKGVKLTQADLNRIKKNHHYTYVAEIPEELWKEGTVVYVTFMGEHDSNKIDMADWVDSFVIYQGGKWSKYEG